MRYRIIFWGNSYHSIKIFRLQKRVIRIIVCCGNRDFCRNLCKKLNILPSLSQYLLSQRIFVVNNSDQFLINYKICNINTIVLTVTFLWQIYMFIKGEFTIQVLRFPFNIKFSDNPRTFKSALKLYVNSFYSLNEYYNNSS